MRADLRGTRDWVIVSESGVSTKEQFLSFVSSGALTHSAMERVSEARVRIHGETAVLTARVTNTAHYDGRQFEADEWVTDVFVCREGRWLCVLSQITAVGQAAERPAVSDIEAAGTAVTSPVGTTGSRRVGPR